MLQSFMANLTILRTYASKDPARLPNSVLFSHSESTLTVYDAYPKSIFHFLILPRLPSPQLSVHDLDCLKTILESDKTQAKEVINALKTEATNLRKDIEGEMLNRYGFKWDVWIGFHAVPSMR
jgi:aprataxin